MRHLWGLLKREGRLCARLLCPWNFPGKDTGVGCHFLLQEIFPARGQMSHPSPALAGGFFTTSATWEASEIACVHAC